MDIPSGNEGKPLSNASDSFSQFPWKLHEMLNSAEQEGYEDVVSWLPGKVQNSFKVHKKDEFVHDIMPRFFKQTKYKSFLRQLNLWGFERVLNIGPTRGSYRHTFFVKNKVHLCFQMKRTKIKGSRPKGDQGNISPPQSPSPDFLIEAHLPSDPIISVDHASLPESMPVAGTSILPVDHTIRKASVTRQIENISSEDMKYVIIGMKLGNASGSSPLYDFLLYDFSSSCAREGG